MAATVIVDALAWVLLIAPVVDWIAVAILGYRSHRYPTIRTLRERAIAAIVLSLAATGIAYLAANRLHLVTVPNPTALGLLAGALVLVSVPNAYWLVLFASGRLGPIREDER